MAGEEVRIGDPGLPGLFDAAGRAGALVVFAHGSGSSRSSPRNRYVSEVMQRYGLATLRFDLLSLDEAGDRAKVFDLPLLSARLAMAIEWARARPDLQALPIGLFGASTGAGAALMTAAEHPQWVYAVVSRGGRPDLAGAALARVRAPTLLLVGGLDAEVLALNRRAQALLSCENRLEVVPGATHLFEEAGALETVAHLAATWFRNHLPA